MRKSKRRCCTDAAVYNRESVLEAMLAREGGEAIDLAAVDAHGSTALDHARGEGHKTLEAMLARHAAAERK